MGLLYDIQQNISECENMTTLGCPARDHAKGLMLLELTESKNPVEMCREQCCIGCKNICGYRCGKAELSTGDKTKSNWREHIMNRFMEKV